MKRSHADIAYRQRRLLFFIILAVLVIASVAVIAVIARRNAGDSPGSTEARADAGRRRSTEASSDSAPATDDTDPVPGSAGFPGFATESQTQTEPPQTEPPQTEPPTTADLPPVLWLTGDTVIVLTEGETYTEPGFTAADAADGDLTAQVTVSGAPDTWAPGTYELRYTVQDTSGNTVSVTRTVQVVAAPETTPSSPGEDPAAVDPATSVPEQIPAGNGKTVYLTYDDGPWLHTERLLGILDSYGVKVTFFVTAAEPSYLPLLAEEQRRGHTVAIHSYTHDYAQIYIGEDAFFADFERISAVVEQQIGYRPTLLRFPGGSSNQKSVDYLPGIMTRLTAAVTERGLRYCDWNVSSGDGNGTLTAEQVFANVIDGVTKCNGDAIVLMHDTQGTTVDATPAIIEALIAAGYTIAPITDQTPLVHHHVYN